MVVNHISFSLNLRACNLVSYTLYHWIRNFLLGNQVFPLFIFHPSSSFLSLKQIFIRKDCALESYKVVRDEPRYIRSFFFSKVWNYEDYYFFFKVQLVCLFFCPTDKNFSMQYIYIHMKISFSICIYLGPVSFFFFLALIFLRYTFRHGCSGWWLDVYNISYLLIW